MIPVLVMAGVLWGVGAAMGAPQRQRWTMIGVLALAVGVALLALPTENPVRQALGGDIRLWLMLAGGAALVVGYRRILAGAKARAGAAPVETATAPSRAGFSDAELDRYARHIVLHEIGGPGQRALREARVLVVGAGGLGSPALLYLAGAGVGTLGVIDPDTVDATNLHRQVIHDGGTVGMPKVHSAAARMRAINPFVTVRPYHRALTADIAEDLIADYDLVLDGTDSFEARYAVNAACAARGVPLIGGALTQWEGQVSVYDPARGAPCYACLFPQAPDRALVPTCAEAGVAGPLPGVIGAIMALEAVKVITGAGEALRGRLMLWDGLYADARVIGAARRTDCAVCGHVSSDA